MTEKEYEEIIATQDALISSLKDKIAVANKKKYEAVEDFCQSLEARYTDFMGKKVEIEFAVSYRNGCEPIVKSYVGFLQGFTSMRYRKDIYPIVQKLKKDGTESKNRFSEWQMENYKCISNIKVIE